MKSVSSSLFNFQYGHWRKSRGPHSCRPTTPLQTAACTPTPRAALYRPSTAVPTRARSLSRRNSIPGRSPVGRTAKQRIPLPAPRSSPLRGGRVTVMVCFLLFLCTSIAPNLLDQSLSVNVNPRFHIWGNLRQVYKREDTHAKQLVFTLPPSPTVRPSCVLAHATTNDDLNPKWGSLATWGLDALFFLCPCLQSLQVDIQRVEWGIQLLALLKYTYLLNILKPA